MEKSVIRKASSGNDLSSDKVSNDRLLRLDDKPVSGVSGFRVSYPVTSGGALICLPFTN